MPHCARRADWPDPQHGCPQRPTNRVPAPRHPGRECWRGFRVCWHRADLQGFFNLIDGDANAKDDVKVPDSDLGKEIEKAFEEGKDLMVTIVAAMGESSPLILAWIMTDPQTRSRRSPGRRPPRTPKRHVHSGCDSDCDPGPTRLRPHKTNVSFRITVCVDTLLSPPPIIRFTRLKAHHSFVLTGCRC